MLKGGPRKLNEGAHTVRKSGAATFISSPLVFTRLVILTVLITVSAGISLFVEYSTAAQRPAATKGVIYAVMDNGDLRWNRHDGRVGCSFRWATPTGKAAAAAWNRCTPF